MRFVLFILALLFWGLGFFLFAMAKSAMHETTAGLIGLHGTVFFVGAAIVDTLRAGQRPE
jgi:hypothetical protein